MKNNESVLIEHAEAQDIEPIILACSSAPGRSMRAMIRMSGANLQAFLCLWLGLDQLELIFQPRVLCRFELPEKDPCIPNAAMGVFFAGPRSYTGEDTLEMITVGRPIIVNRLMELLLQFAEQAGYAMRMAEPGEFTRRAYLNGRLDLTQAEGVAATINAVSDAQLNAAGILRQGLLGKLGSQMVEDLAGALALVEVGIDFVEEEDVVPIPPGDLYERISRIHGQVVDMLKNARSWSMLDQTPWVVLVGEPNAGKSSLFNELLGKQRAVVSPFAGATRDILIEPMTLSDGTSEIMLVDMAGKDSGQALIEVRMRSQADAATRRAELAIAMRNPDQMPVADGLLEGLNAESVIRVYSQCDRVGDGPGLNENELAISVQTGEGLSELHDLLKARLLNRAVSLSGEIMTLQPRHESDLRQVEEELGLAIEMLDWQRCEAALHDVELVAIHLRVALDALAALGGQMTPDDVLGKIFSGFCIGK